jgi:hypothetical protein
MESITPESVSSTINIAPVYHVRDDRLCIAGALKVVRSTVQPEDPHVLSVKYSRSTTRRPIVKIIEVPQLRSTSGAPEEVPEFKQLALASFKRREAELVEQLSQKAWNDILSNLAVDVAFTADEVGWKDSRESHRDGQRARDASPGPLKARGSNTRSAATETVWAQAETPRNLNGGLRSRVTSVC